VFVILLLILLLKQDNQWNPLALGDANHLGVCFLSWSCKQEADRESAAAVARSLGNTLLPVQRNAACLCCQCVGIIIFTGAPLILPYSVFLANSINSTHDMVITSAPKYHCWLYASLPRAREGERKWQQLFICHSWFTNVAAVMNSVTLCVCPV